MPKLRKCDPGCTCGLHRRAKCAPECTCWRHNPSPEMVAKLREMSGNRLGTKQSDEHRRKISAALTGKPLSEEHRRKMAAINADPDLLKRKAESRKALRKPPETHRAVHRRLFRDKGLASNQACVDCSRPADAWAHDWSTWEDIAQDLHGKRLTFSTNPDAYRPRCHECHNQLDRTPRPWAPARSRTGAKLTEDDVLWIRTSGLSSGEMAAVLGIHQGTVCHIRAGKTWKDVSA